MRYPALAIANYFIDKATQNGQGLSPMKLIKLVYFAHCWNLVLCHQSLINENIEAWQYGPVIPSIYRYYKKFGNDEITELAPIDIEYHRKLIEDKITLKILDKIWDVYGQYTAIQLSNMTHEKGTPWYIAWHEQNAKAALNYTIDNELIRKHFTKQEAPHHEG